ncbi:hypothetical protein B0H66DRAFT_1073 [Apodospora peruviana]|uniref:Uncharacterized protein n=1 Tax=Apodospora peruviana TaxID=516989 RepID=A0AAE0MF51_9PEZI|nr:hypothetical protein B0H66DRAFT_1073 [Apodospora peruviana]
MNSQTVGVRLFFATLGTTINAYWNYYFSYTSESQIHHLLAKRPHQARSSILLSPPSNVFARLWRSVRPIKDPLSFNAALATFFAKFTPIVLSNISFSNAVTWRIHEACTWMAVAFLAHMFIVLGVSLVLPLLQDARKNKRAVMVAEVELPVRTDTIAGCMYYLCESKDGQGLLRDCRRWAGRSEINFFLIWIGGTALRTSGVLLQGRLGLVLITPRR